jgi:hypothetical protein
MTGCPAFWTVAPTEHGWNQAIPRVRNIDLLRPYAPENMHCWSVGQRVGNVRNDDPHLIEPLSPAPESSLNLSLFPD